MTTNEPNRADELLREVLNALARLEDPNIDPTNELRTCWRLAAIVRELDVHLAASGELPKRWRKAEPR